MALSNREKLAAAVTRVCDPVSGWAPYFGTVLRGLVRRETPELPTLAVTKNGLLLWGPAFVSKVTVDVLAYGLMHEVLHVLLKHFERAAAIGAVSAEDSQRANLCEDACINEELAKTWPIPDWFVVPATLGQAPGLIFEERYRLLRQEDEKQGKGGGEGEGGEGKGKSGQPQRGVGSGSCGSCSGNAAAGEKGEDSDARSEAEMDRFRRETAQEVREYSAKNPGKVPASIDRWAGEMLAPPRVDWRAQLARAVRAAVAYQSGAVDFSWNKPSRRQAGVGFGVGRPLVPSFRTPVPRVAVVVDTSGSMGAEELKIALSEVQGVLRSVGASVDFVECDAAVQGIKTIGSIAQVKLKGGGGTSMTPAFEALEKLRTRPEVVIVCTDGFIGDGYPAIEPSWCRTVWTIIGENTERCCPWGDTVFVAPAVKENAA